MEKIIKGLLVTFRTPPVPDGLRGRRRTLIEIHRYAGKPEWAYRPRRYKKARASAGHVVGVPLGAGEWVQSHINTLVIGLDYAPGTPCVTLTVYRMMIGPSEVVWEHQADTEEQLWTPSTLDHLDELRAAWPLPVPADIARNRTRRINDTPGKCQDCGDGVPIAQGRLAGFGPSLQVRCWPPRCRRRKPATCPITEPHCGFCRTTLAPDGWVQVRDRQACSQECAALMIRRRGAHDALYHGYG